MKNRKYIITGILIGLMPFHIWPVIFESTGDADFNTTAPEGVYESSGWEYQGYFGAFTGTPIASRYFITARHIGGRVGDRFIYRGQNYLTTSYYPDRESDLIIWEVDGEFPDFAPTADSPGRILNEVVVFGRGTRRGNPVFASDDNNALRGWDWGPSDGRLRWGLNSISGYLDRQTRAVLPFFSSTHFITCRFDTNAGINECHLSRGDSGGGVFIRESGEWRLLAINYAVSGPYRTSETGQNINAALFDTRGIYQFTGQSWEITERGNFPVPGYFISTLVSARSDWVQQVLNLANNESEPIQVIAASTVDGDYQPVAQDSIDWNSSTISLTLNQDKQTQFLKLRSPGDYTITGITTSGNQLTLTFK